MKYADVIVDLSLQKLDRVFQYRIPDGLKDVLEPGMQVMVPFGKGGRILKGYVVELSDEPSWDLSRMKEIISVAEGAVKLEGQLIALASWMRGVYGCTMNQALKTVLPVRSAVRGRTNKRVRLSVDKDKALEYRGIFGRKHQTARLRLLDALIDEGELVFPEAGRKYSVSNKTVGELVEMGLASTDGERIYRNPVRGSGGEVERTVPTPAQHAVVDDILRRRASGDLRPSLIHGVTGSGKTLIYMELIAAVLDEGREAIVLIPEIALTYQTVQRFYGRFGDAVSVLHSRLSEGERYDQIKRVESGKVKVMIGPRSALFTPFRNLGIIIIDEEHEGSYKSETVPRYHAREAALKRAGMCGAAVVMGSATPSVDSYKKSLEGEFRLYTLEDRVGGRSLPSVEVVDLRAELKNGNRSIFSRSLRERMEEALSRHEQVMLFLNRRGYAGFVSCRACGYVVKCPHCDVSLSLHSGGFMLCHYCGYKTPEVRRCPSCGSAYIGAFRAGTQQVAGLIGREFPGARVLRMDRDTVRHKGAYDEILDSFAGKEADILVGTQMIVKGHDFPGVTLVGVLAADMSLHEGDYRSAEKTFQLITQACGRAGRGESGGTAVVQTYNPCHYSIVSAAAQDYGAFYKKEIAYRNTMGYPPVSHMTAVCLTSADEEALIDASLKLKEAVIKDVKEVTVLGPADGFPARVKDTWRKALYLKSENIKQLMSAKHTIEEYAAQNNLYKDINIQFDLDPVNPF